MSNKQTITYKCCQKNLDGSGEEGGDCHGCCGKKKWEEAGEADVFAAAFPRYYEHCAYYGHGDGNEKRLFYTPL